RAIRLSTSQDVRNGGASEPTTKRSNGGRCDVRLATLGRSYPGAMPLQATDNSASKRQAEQQPRDCDDGHVIRHTPTLGRIGDASQYTFVFLATAHGHVPTALGKCFRAGAHRKQHPSAAQPRRAKCFCFASAVCARDVTALAAT